MEEPHLLSRDAREEFMVATTSIRANHYEYTREIDQYPREPINRLIHTPLLWASFAVSPVIVDPFGFIATSTQFQEQTKGVKYMKFDVKMIVSVSATPNTYGVLYIRHHVPRKSFTRSQVNADPILIDLGKSDTVEVIYPYISPYEYLQFGQPTFMSELEFIYEGEAATGEKPLVKVWFTPVNVVLKGALAVAQMNQGGGVIPSVMMAGALLTGSITQLKTYSDQAVAFGKDIEKVKENVNQLYTSLNGKKEDAPEVPKANAPLVYGNMSVHSYVPEVRVNSRQIVRALPHHLGDNKITHNVLDVARIPCIRYKFTLAETLSKELILEPLMVRPADEPGLYTTYFDSIARLFRYWRGGMELNILVYVPALVTGKVTLALTNVDRFQATPYNGTNQVLHEYRKFVTIKGSTNIKVTIPYISSATWSAVGLTTNGGVATGTRDKVWRFYITMTELTLATGFTVVPQFVVLARPAPDLQFKSITSPVTAQAQMHVHTQFEDPEMSWNMRPYQKLPNVPEDYLTLEDLANRWSTRIIAQTTIYNQYNAASTGAYDTLDYVSSMFLFSRGNIRWMVQSTGTQSAPTIVRGSQRFGFTNVARVIQDPAGVGITVTDPTTNPVAKFETTYDSKLDWGLTAQVRADSLYFVEPIGEQQGEPYELNYGGTTSVFSYAAAGAGYQLAYLLPPSTPGLAL